MDQRVAIVGAGASGMLACKYTKERGFSPVVFEAEDCIGGIWNHTIKSTKLQTAKQIYQFFDFPWPSSVKEMSPSHTQVREYFESYAQHFDIYRYIRFNSQVVSIDYDGVSQEEMEFWDLWSGTSKAFSSKGKWLIEVQDTKTCSREVYKFEFVILCIGRFCGLPNIPEFPLNQGPEVFNGKVLHSMDYSAMDEESANKLIKGKRVTVIGSQKSVVDITAECADENGVEYPCTMIRRTDHWLLPTVHFLGVHLGYLYFNRFAELLVHKPGQSFLHTLLATLLSPLRWVITKIVESYLLWKLPLKKHGAIPEHSFSPDLSSCQIGMLPENFYDKVEEGSIILKKSQKFSFCKKGLIIDGQTQPLETDVVILATGYNSDQKLSNIFKSHIFQKSKTGSPNYSVSLYRQIIHPRIPQLAIIGYAGFTTLGASEIKCQWLVHFLDGTIELPSIREMEKDVTLWENHMKKYSGRYFWRGCNIIGIWYNDQICRDIGCESRRKKGFLPELFEPYSASNYAGLGRKK